MYDLVGDYSKNIHFPFQLKSVLFCSQLPLGDNDDDVHEKCVVDKRMSPYFDSFPHRLKYAGSFWSNECAPSKVEISHSLSIVINVLIHANEKVSNHSADSFHAFP